MLVLMMSIREMRMGMGHGRVLVRVAVRSTRCNGPAVHMLMVRIVTVFMRMRQRSMDMGVLMSLGQVQPQA